MSLLQEIQAAAVEADSDLGTILRKCKLLAARLGSKQLEDWLLWESNGYPDEVEVPDYRIWPLQVWGQFSSVRYIRKAPVPTAALPEKARDHYRRYKCQLSVAAVENALCESDDGMIHVSTDDLALMLGDVFAHENCIQSWAEFGTQNLVELLNSVRNRVLDFALAVWKEYPEAGEANSSNPAQVSPAAISQIFNTTVYGGSANLVGNVTESTVTFNVERGDFDTLREVLVANDVAEEDIEELSQALQAEDAPTEAGKYGPRVSAWISKMMRKAADGSWKIGLGAAGTLVAQLIAKFYGLG